MTGYVSNNGIIHTLHLPFKDIFNILQTLIGRNHDNGVSCFNSILTFGNDNISLTVNAADEQIFFEFQILNGNTCNLTVFANGKF